MSSQDFPGPSWQDRPASDDWRAGYRPVGEDSYRQPNPAPPNQYGANQHGANQHGAVGRDNGNGYGSYGHGQANGSQGHPSGQGSAGRAGANGSDGYGNGRGGGNGQPPAGGPAAYPAGGRSGERNGNGYGSARPGNGYGPVGYPDNGSRPTGVDGADRGDRSVPGGRRVATGRHGARRGDQDYGGAAGDDTGAWYRPVGRSASTRTAMRRPAGPGYDPSAADPYRSGGTGSGPGGPGNGRRGQRRGDRDIRALVDPDGQTPLPLKIVRRLWYGRWWRQWSFKKVGLLFGALCATMALALVATFFVVLHATRVPLRALSEPLTQSSQVYFSNDKLVGCFCAAGRISVTEHDIERSHALVAAVLAAEDRSFFKEGGISVTGLLRAAKNDLFGGSFNQGGSTITEQLVKTYYDESLLGNLSLGTKLKEIFVSIKLARMEPKPWILTRYLNAIPLGNSINGVESAAQTYFRTDAWKLTVAQAAMIAAMIQQPSGYQPDDPTAPAPGVGTSLLERWIYVLTNMVRDGYINQARFNGLVPDPSNPNSKANLAKFPKISPPLPQENWSGYRGYIMQLVQYELAAYYNINATVTQLGNMGLQIHTSINENMMNALARDVAGAKSEMAAAGVKLPSYVHITSVVEKPGSGRIVAFYGGPGYGVKHCKSLHCDIDTILQAEPVGSSFKPYVLATAVDEGMNVNNSVLNSHSPLCIPPDWTTLLQLQRSKQTLNCHSLGYQLFHEGGEDSGRTNDSVVVATATSNDPAFEDLIHRTGVEKVINMAGTLGVSPADVQGLNNLFGPKGGFPGSVQAALGEGSLSAVDQANTFSTLVSGGWRATPHIIDHVSERGVPLVGKYSHYQAVPQAVAADTDYALSFDTNPSIPGATGVPNAVWDGRPMIGKTGTLGQGANSSEAWFIGAIPQYSMSVALFTNRPGGTNPEILDGLPPRPGWAGSYGGAWPATIWQRFMSGEFTNLAAKPLPTPSYAGTNPQFVKWVQALPPKKKKRCQQPGPGKGNGNGNGGGGLFGRGSKQCQKGGGPNPTNSPTPNPSNTPSPHPTVTLTPPGPSNTPTPSISPSTALPTPFTASHRQRVPSHTVNTVGLTAVAVLPSRPIRRPASIVTSSLV